uniref:Uncharacterized protein n=1 Tax=Rhizophagus irregularis (strain DAOM 181602 / DAOM 197198 / MUCL 43194) TaxID=747089 RepID=U9V4X8_RHIID
MSIGNTYAKYMVDLETALYCTKDQFLNPNSELDKFFLKYGFGTLDSATGKMFLWSLGHVDSVSTLDFGHLDFILIYSLILNWLKGILNKGMSDKENIDFFNLKFSILE